jgi:signal peptidase I
MCIATLSNTSNSSTLSFLLGRYVRGDVVIATSPTNPDQTVCKRIRAVGGDTVFLPPALAYYGRLNGWNKNGSRDDVAVSQADAANSIAVNSHGNSAAQPPLSPPQALPPRLPPNALVVPQGYIWLEGDNSLNSTDSRYYGPVPSALVKGRVVVRWNEHQLS